MRMGGRLTARRAEEDELPHPHHVERRQHRGEGEHAEHHRGIRQREVQDGILGEETGQAGRPDDRQHAEGEGRKRHRQPAEPTHSQDVLLMVAGVDDRTGTEEEQRLEERVRREVEHRGPRSGRDRNLVGRRAVTVAHPQRAEAEGGHHVAELRQRRVSQDLLDVVLDDRAKRRIQGGHRADPQDDIERDRRRREERLDPAQHVDARRHHGRRVDERRHRGRAFHRVRQPHVQRHLGRLAKGTAEEQERDARRDHLAATHGGRDLGQVHRAERGLAPEDAEEEAEVADAIHDERLLGRIGRRGLLVVMVDQEVGAEAHQFPEHENHQQVVREHDAEHREHEDRQPAEVARARPVIVHVAE
jgi:hypothetical protein